MRVSTHRLFTRLLPLLRVSAVCDVGSMNGADAARFSAALPRARVYAFEPNPRNFGLMAARRAYFQQHNISLVPAAASNHDGAAEFYLVEAEYSRPDPRRGMSSLYARTGQVASAVIVEVRTTRLDSFLAAACQRDERLAVWIDCEGAAYEVIEGMSGIAGQVQLLHVEVETTPCISAQQKLYPQVRSLLQQHGFTELAIDQRRSHEQFNALYVRSDLPAAMRLLVGACLLQARLRLLLGGAVRWLCPACALAYRRWQSRAPA
jgi:FkbM family methyltransferase